MNHDVGIARSVSRGCEWNAKLPRYLRAVRVDVDEPHVAARKTRCQPRHEASDRPAANHGHPITQVRTRIPQAVQRGFEIGGQHGSPGRDVVWQHMQCRSGDDALRLMRMQHEHRLTLQIAWSGLDATYAGISVLDRRRKLALLKRSAHARPLAPRHPAVEDERLRTATDPAEERA